MEIPTQIERGKLVGKTLKLNEMKLGIFLTECLWCFYKNSLWLKIYISELLATTLKSDKNVDNRVLCIWGLTVLMVEEVLHGVETSGGLVKVIILKW